MSWELENPNPGKISSAPYFLSPVWDDSWKGLRDTLKELSKKETRSFCLLFLLAPFLPMTNSWDEP